MYVEAGDTGAHVVVQKDLDVRKNLAPLLYQFARKKRQLVRIDKMIHRMKLIATRLIAILSDRNYFR